MKTSFAIIGCGRIAKRHAEQINKVGQVTAVCDIVYDNAFELAEIYGANLYLGIEELLENEPGIDVVTICTPNGLHAQHSILSLKAQKHVLCEKPLCINIEDAKNMLRVAQQTNQQLYIVKQNRYNPPVVALKKLLKEDRLGKIFSFQVNCFWNRPHHYYDNTWRGSKDLDGGTLYTQFSHFIDLIYWLLGDVTHVKAITRNYEHPTIDIEDTGVVLLETLGGATGTLNYTVNSYNKNMEGSFTIFGEYGTVKIGGQYLNELEYQCIAGEPIQDLPQGKAPNTYGFYQGSMSNHGKVYENLMAALKNPNHEFANAFEGMKTVEIIEKIYASAALK